MEKKKGAGKYFLVFEPAYACYQYAVYFNSNSQAEVTKVYKYSDIPYKSSGNKKVKKNLLGDIDRIMSSCSDINDFFEKYIDPNIFAYCGGNLYKMFIGRKRNDYLYKLNYVINNQELGDRLLFLNGSKINDTEGRRSIINLILTSENNGFVKFINGIFEQQGLSKECITSISKETVDLVNRLRIVYDGMDGFSEQSEIKELLNEKLTSYKEYREMFLLKQHYVDSLNKQKNELLQLKQDISPNPTLIPRGNSFLFDVELPDYEQLNLFGKGSREGIKVKKK